MLVSACRWEQGTIGIVEEIAQRSMLSEGVESVVIDAKVIGDRRQNLTFSHVFRHV